MKTIAKTTAGTAIVELSVQDLQWVEELANNCEVYLRELTHIVGSAHNNEESEQYLENHIRVIGSRVWRAAYSLEREINPR